MIPTTFTEYIALSPSEPITNCTTCKHEAKIGNQCWLLCGHTSEVTIRIRADYIRMWRQAVGLHTDTDWSSKRIEPTANMLGCPSWAPKDSPHRGDPQTTAD